MSDKLSLLKGLKAFALDGMVEIKNHNRRKSTATSPRHDDLYMVSFPKSGTTWMNFLMANLHVKMSGLNRSVTFFNIHDILPDIHRTRSINAESLPFPGYRVIKSHSEFNPDYLKVIYLVRDPRDTLISYYYFLRGLGHFDGDLSSLIRSESFGIAAWVRHIEGWLNSPAGLRIAFVRYEDLKADTSKELCRLYGLLGHELDAGIVTQAIRASSFEVMRASELDWNYGQRPGVIHRNLKFMRSGKSGEWKEALSANDLTYIESVAKPYMQHFCYE